MKKASMAVATALGLLLVAAPVATASNAQDVWSGETAAQNIVSIGAKTANELMSAAHPISGDRSTRHDGGMTREEFESFRLKKLQEIATYFGINTEGKTAAQLKEEVEAAKTANKEKWEAFKAEHKAERMEHLRRMAEKHGIKTEGKTFEQLREELHKLHQGGKKEHNPSGNNKA